MTDTTDDIAEEISLQSFDDDCKLLGNLLNDVLQREVGSGFMEKLERNRVLAQVRRPPSYSRNVLNYRFVSLYAGFFICDDDRKFYVILLSLAIKIESTWFFASPPIEDIIIYVTCLSLCVLMRNGPYRYRSLFYRQLR